MLHLKQQRALRGILLSLAAVGVASGCFLFNPATTQCTTAADCVRFGQELACENNSCVARAPAADSGAPADECASNRECIERALGEPAICSRPDGPRRCVNLRAASTCRDVLPSPDELTNDNVLLIGAFAPLKGGSALNEPERAAYELALKEIQEVGGLPGGSGKRRPLVALVCDTSETAAAGEPLPPVESNLNHLVDTVRVPAIVSLFSQQNMARLIQDVTAPKGVFVVNPVDTTIALKAADVSLAWHLLGTPDDVARGYRPLLARTEAYLRTTRSITRPLRLALVRTSNNGTLAAMSDTVHVGTAELQINGGGLQQATSSGLFREFLVDTQRPGEAVPATTTAAIDQLVGFEPDVVVMLTYTEASTIIPSLERGLSARLPPGSLPYYLLSPYDDGSALSAYIQNADVVPSASKTKRFLGLQYAGSEAPEPREKFRARMRARFPLTDTKIDPEVYYNKENYYDAIYWLAYGFYAAGSSAPVEGRSFRYGVGLLNNPRPPIVEPGGAETVSSAFSTINASGQAGVSFVGALGTPNVGPNGIWKSVAGVYCFSSAGKIVRDSLRYEEATGQFKGTLSCYSDF